MMFGYICVCVFFMSVMAPVASQLTSPCMEATSGCTTTLSTELLNGTDFCSAMTNFFSCVGAELAAAEEAKTCDQSSIESRKRVELETIDELTSTNICNISTPSSLTLDTCFTEIDRCRQLVTRAPDTAADVTTKCREIETFFICMAEQTLSCQDISVLNDVLVEEITNSQYEKDCVGAPSSPPVPTPATTQFPVSTPQTSASPSVQTTATLFPPTTSRSFTPSTETRRPTTQSPLTTPTTVTPSRPSGQAVSLDDLNTLKSDLQQSLDFQTFMILQAMDQQFQTLQSYLPSSPLITSQLNNIESELTKLQNTFKSEFQSHFEMLEEVVQTLISGLEQRVNQSKSGPAQNNGYPIWQTNISSTESCFEKVMKILREISPEETWSAEHYVRVSRLGRRRQTVSTPESIVMSFSNWQDMLAISKGEDAFRREKIGMEMHPGYLRLTCSIG